MNTNIKQLFEKINLTKSKESIEFEKGFLLPLSLTAIIFSAVSLVVNIILGFDFLLIMVPMVSLVIFILVYFLAKNDQYVVRIKWLFLIVVFIFINLIWYYNYGSHGPWFYLLVLLYSYLIFMMHGRQLLLVSLLLVINVTVLFIYEYHFPNVVGNYPNDHARIIDSYTAIFLYGVVVYVLMTIVKRYYLLEYQKAKESDRLKSSFLANMSHEIRTPLNAIVGFSNLLAEDDVNEEEKQQYVDIINQSNSSLLRLIDDVLDVSLIEANQMKIKQQEFDVNKLFENLYAAYLKVLQEKHKKQLKLEVQIPNTHYFITSDASRINQLMINLLDNAIKFTHKGGIVFGFKKVTGGLHFFVTDTGIGIPHQYQKALFERFFKIEENKEELYRGTGIGLYLCKKIVELMGGRIWFTSEVNKGSDFHFIIPATGFREVLTDDSEHELKKETDTFSFKEASVLIVEDDKSSSIYLSRLLESIGVTVRTAVTGKEAVDIFRALPGFDLVLLDIRLPDASGLDVIKDLKRINSRVPVIAQTAFAMMGDEKKCYDAGFDDYIAKPIPKDLLVEKITYFLEKHT